MTPILAVLLFVLGLPPAARPDVVVIHAAKLYVGDGKVLSPAVVVVTGGKITFVGGQAPGDLSGARHVRITDAVVTPGFIESASTVGLPGGLSENEEATEVTPSIRVAPLLNPRDEGFRRLREVGVTTAVVCPGNRNVIGGIDALVKTKDSHVAADLVVKPEVALHAVMSSEPASGNSSARFGGIGLFTRRPNSRMGVVFELRHAFLDGTIRGQKGAPSWTRFDDDEGNVMMSTIRGELPVEIVAHNQNEILTALHITDEFRVPKFYLQGGVEAYVLRDLLARRGVPVFIGPIYHRSQVPLGVFISRHQGTGGQVDGAPLFTENGGEVGAPRMLKDAGVKFAFSCGTSAAGATLRDYASAASRAGLPEGDAIAALTGWAASILGVADRVGTIAPGKDADLNVYSGDPLSPASRLELVLIDGAVVFRAPETTAKTKE